jgi:hypothetical protein
MTPETKCHTPLTHQESCGHSGNPDMQAVHFVPELFLALAGQKGFFG